MGVTIESKNKSIDMGYIGFRALRTTIAGLTELDIKKHYDDLTNGMHIFREEERKKFFQDYDEETEIIDKKYDYKYNKVLAFLYASDCNAELNVDVCKDLYEIIKDYNDDKVYGYSGREDCATFKDFKELVKDCIDNNSKMIWF